MKGVKRNFRFSDSFGYEISNKVPWTCLDVGSPHLAVEAAHEPCQEASVT